MTQHLPTIEVALCECKWAWWKIDDDAQAAGDAMCPSRKRRLPFFMRGLDEDDMDY